MTNDQTSFLDIFLYIIHVCVCVRVCVVGYETPTLTQYNNSGYPQMLTLLLCTFLCSKIIAWGCFYGLLIVVLRKSFIVMISFHGNFARILCVCCWCDVCAKTEMFYTGIYIILSWLDRYAIFI